jgi:hypothetical protein
MQLAGGTWLLAVSRGFGWIGGVRTEAALLARLRLECERRLRSPRFRRAVERPQAAATAMLAVLERVNASLHASTASHEDYVTAAASLTVVLVVARYAYVMHAGGTAAYLVRDGEIAALCADDILEERPFPVLSRAFAVAPTLDISISNARLGPGDAIVLLGRRVASDAERRALLQRLDASEPGEQILVARFEEDAATTGACERSSGAAYAAVMLVRAAAALGFLFAAVLAH